MLEEKVGTWKNSVNEILSKKAVSKYVNPQQLAGIGNQGTERLRNTSDSFNHVKPQPSNSATIQSFG